VLVGRKRERDTLNALVEGAKQGRGAALLVTGEPGIGKTALLDDAVERLGARMTVLSASGSESDRDLPFSTLGSLLRSTQREFRTLPLPQARALARAVGVDVDDDAVDRLSVGVATLGVFMGLAGRNPLLVVVDDLHWVDEASRGALLFAARRLEGRSVAMLLAAREELPELDVEGLPRLELAGLRRRDATALLAHVTGGSIDAGVRRQLLEISDGSPLALVELPVILSGAQLAGLDPLGDPIPVNGGIERAFGGRVARLPERTRTALLIAAATGPDADETLTSALELQELELADLTPAVADGLATVSSGRVFFRHPMVRSVVYHSHGEEERRVAHRTLAEVAHDPDRRVWHLYAAANGADESLAVELDAAAGRALGRGAPASAARAFEAAAAVTPDAEERGRRLTGAARAAHRAGEVSAARRFSAAARELTADPLALADLLLVDSDLRMRDGDLEGAHRALVGHAEELVPIDRRRAATMLLLAAKLRIYRLEAQVAVNEVENALALLPAGEHDVVHLVALSMSQTVAGRDGARDTAFAAAAAAARAPHGHAHTLGIAWPLIWLEEYDAARDVIARATAIQREGGFLVYLPQTLLALAELDFRTGDWTSADQAAVEAIELLEETEQPSEAASAAAVLCRIEAARGNDDACRALAQRAFASDVEFGLRSASAFALAALGLLALAGRRPEEAVAPLEAAERIAGLGDVGEPWLILSAPDLVEALARSGHHAQARETLARFEDRVGSRTSASAAAERCAGILATNGWHEHFERALELHQAVPTPFERARSELCYGERLRRGRRRSEAREHLRLAARTFDELEARPWAERARTELRASGERVRRRSSPMDTLTPQELAVARLVADGLKNREAAAALFVSEKTIEFHLASVYRKLGIRSRVALARLLAQPRRSWVSR
jgi:DNA-binding CsgD family transcriptional regulator